MGLWGYGTMAVCKHDPIVDCFIFDGVVDVSVSNAELIRALV